MTTTRTIRLIDPAGDTGHLGNRPFLEGTSTDGRSLKMK